MERRNVYTVVISPLRITNEQIAAHQRARMRRDSDRRRLEEPIQAVDSVIAECEELLLIGRKRVPPSMEVPLRRLAMLCPDRAVELHPGVTITRLMDELFDLQEDLLGRRVDRAAFPDLDETA
jgi:hypothetical protein